MLSRSWIRRAEEQAFQDRAAFQLQDGSLYRYDYTREAGRIWAYCTNLMVRSKWLGVTDEEPEIVTKIRQARDPYAAIEPFRPNNPERAFVDPIILLQDAPETNEDAL